MMWVLAPFWFVALVAAFVVWAVRGDRRRSLESEIQASMSRRYELSRDVWFGREQVAVVRDGREWAQWTPPPAPVLEAAPVEVEEGAA